MNFLLKIYLMYGTSALSVGVSRKMNFADNCFNVRICVLSSLLMLCTSCSVTYSNQSVRVKRADDSTISDVLSQKIKVRVFEDTGAEKVITDEFTGDKTVTVNASGGKRYVIELRGADEMADKCIYGKTELKPEKKIDTDKLPAGFLGNKVLEDVPRWVDYSPVSFSTTSTAYPTILVLSPTDVTVNMFWNYYDYPDTVSYYPKIHETDECMKWLKESGYGDGKNNQSPENVSSTETTETGDDLRYGGICGKTCAVRRITENGK